VTEEMLDFISLNDTDTGENIFNKVYEILVKYNLPLSRLVCVATDGAKAMVGKFQRFVARLLAEQDKLFRNPLNLLVDK